MQKSICETCGQSQQICDDLRTVTGIACESDNLQARVQVKAVTPARTGYFCHKLQIPLQYVCGNTACTNHIDFVQSDNCILAHAAKNDADGFTLTEISYLTKIHLSTVNKLFRTALHKLRKVSIDQEVEQDDIVRDFVMKPNNHTCVVCESLTSLETCFFYDPESHFVWCSSECFEEQHVTEIELEWRYGVTCQDLIIWLVRKFGCTWSSEDSLLYQMAQAVSLDLSAFKILLDKYKEKALHENTTITSKVENLEPVGDRRNLRPLDNLWKMHADLQISLIGLYGKPDLDEKLYKEVIGELHSITA